MLTVSFATFASCLQLKTIVRAFYKLPEPEARSVIEFTGGTE